ncbi:MAG: pilus assembly protein PilP [Methylotenera sp.]|nr:pilus assembly protein PilP [Methylotenera sp.]OQW68549.1 MAG: pilus assembly protein PilP [Proteobacteria bacterium ST_bin12]PPD18949.1 MAG: pilus assembly protein PilP [Methylotenera sp.]
MIRYNSLLKLPVILVLSLLLAACNSSEGDDLDKFMSSSSNTMNKGVEPLPEVLPYSPLQYNADGTLADPFRPRKAASKNGSLQPNTNRPKEALEAYPLESLKYVGLLSRNKLSYALIKTPDNTLQQVKIGNYLGPNYGLVTAINESDIALKEIVQDDLTGDWIERSASINLQE